MIEINIEGDLEDYYCASYLITNFAYVLFENNKLKIESKCKDEDFIRNLFLNELEEYREHKNILNKTNEDRLLIYKKAFLENSTNNKVDDIAKPFE